MSGLESSAVAEFLRDLSGAALVTNTASGANLRNGVVGIDERAAAAGLRHHRIDEIRALDAVLRECARADVRLIIVNAGDGTVCRVLDLIRDGGWFAQEPALALLRGGTTNMIHGDVGWRGRPESALNDMLARLRQGRCHYRERHVLEVRRAGPGMARHGFFFGTHAVVRAVLRTRARYHERAGTGTASELLSLAGMVWRLLRRRVEGDPVLSPIPLELSLNGGEWRQVTHILLMATSLQRMILGARPLARGQRAGVAALSWPDYRLLPWLWRLARGRTEELQRLSLRGEFSWILDGEIQKHRASDGILSVDAAGTVRFLVKGGGT